VFQDALPSSRGNKEDCVIRVSDLQHTLTKSWNPASFLNPTFPLKLPYHRALWPPIGISCSRPYRTHLQPELFDAFYIVSDQADVNALVEEWIWTYQSKG